MCNISWLLFDIIGSFVCDILHDPCIRSLILQLCSVHVNDILHDPCISWLLFLIVTHNCDDHEVLDNLDSNRLGLFESTQDNYSRCMNPKDASISVNILKQRLN